MINQILPYIPYIREAVLFAALIWQRKAISSFLYALLGDSAKPPGNVSHRRVVALSTTATFLYLCYFVVTKSTVAEPKHLEPVIAWSLFLLISLSMAYTTFSQAGSIVANLRGMIPGMGGAAQPVAEKPAPKTEININTNQEA